MGLCSNLRAKIDELLDYHRIDPGSIVNFIREYQYPGDATYKKVISDITSEYEIYAYLKGDSLCYYTEANRVVANTSLARLFKDFCNLKDISGLKNWDTRKTEDFSLLFERCDNLTDLSPIADWKFDNAKDFERMFYGCYKLSDITPLKNWKAKFVINAKNMFSHCLLLADLSPLENWDWQNLANTSYMFDQTAITNLYYARKWDMSKVIDMSYMFYNCDKLCNIDDIRSWYICDYITNMTAMFYGCISLTSAIDLDGWNLYKDGNYVYNKNHTSTVAVSGIFEKKVNDANVPLFNRKYFPIWLPGVQFATLNTGKNLNKLFKLLSTGSQKEVDYEDIGIYYFKAGKLKSTTTNYQQISIDGSVNVYAWFSVNTIYIGNNDVPDTDNPELPFRIVANLDMSYTFANMKALYRLWAFSELDTRRTTDMSFLFYNDASPIDLYPIADWNVRNILSLQSAFENTKGLLTAVPIGTWYLRKNKRLVLNSNDAIVNIKDIFEKSNIQDKWDKYPRWCPMLIDTFLLPGQQVRSIFISLAGGDEEDITAVKASFIQPGGDIGIDYKKISTDESKLPIYASYAGGTIYVFSDGNICGVDLSDLFNGFINAIDLSWIEYIDTKYTTNMSHLFYRCASAANFSYLDLWNVSKVTNMNGMFANSGASSNTLMSTKDWDTSSVVDMGTMFEHDYNITNLNFMNDWDTSSVTNMSYIFDGCAALTNISGITDHEFVTSTCTDISGMFNACTNLSMSVAANSSVSLSEWDVSSVTDMSWMFANNNNFTGVDVTGWDTSSLITVEGMFKSTNIYGGSFLTGINFSHVTNFKKMFQDCQELYWTFSLEDLRDWNVSNGLYFDEMFSNCTHLRSITPIQYWHMDSVISMQRMFEYTDIVTATPLDNWNLVKVSGVVKNSKRQSVNITEIFKGSTLENNADYSLYPRWHPSSAFYVIVNGKLLNKKLKDLARNASDSTIETLENTITSIVFTNGYIGTYVRAIDISDYTEGGQLFAYYNANSTTNTITISSYHKKILLPADMSYAFSGFTALTSITGFSNITSKDMKNMKYMFWKDSSFNGSSLSGLDTSNVINAMGAFSYTSIASENSIKNLPFTDKLINISQLFMGNTSIINATIIKDWNVNGVNDISNLFYGCTALEDAIALSIWPFTNASDHVYNSKAEEIDITKAFDYTSMEMEINKYPSWYPISLYVPMPTNTTPTVEYNGDEQNNGYYKSGRVNMLEGSQDRGTIPGTYTATYKPKEGFMWTDGTTIEISVVLQINNKVAGANPTAIIPVVYDGNEHDNGYTDIPDHVTKLLGSQDKGTDAGTYIATYQLDQYYCWSDGTTENAIRTLLISSYIVGPKPTNPNPITFDWDYHSNGCNFDPNMVSIDGDEGGTNYGSYIAHYIPKENYAWLDGTRDLVEITLTINRAYCGAKPEYTIRRTYVPEHTYTNEYDCPRGVDKEGPDSGIDSETYIARYTPDNNHKWVDDTRTTGTVTLIIEGISVGPKPIDYAHDYNGRLIQNGYNRDPEKVDISEDSIEEAINAGEYIAKYTPKRNYCWNDGTTETINCKLTINRIEVAENPPYLPVDRVYNGKTQSNGYTPIYGIEFDNGESFAIYPGEYKAYYKVSPNHRWKGDVIDPDELWEVVLRIAYLANQQIPQNPDPVTYDGEEHTNGYDLTDRHVHLILGYDKGTNAGTYRAYYAPDLYYAWTDGTTEEKFCDLVINKCPVPAPPEEIPPVTYDEQEHTNGYECPESGVIIGEGSRTKGTNAGEYNAKYTVDFNHIWDDDPEEIYIKTRTLTLIINRFVTSYIKPVDGTIIDREYDGNEHTNEQLVYPEKYVSTVGPIKGTEVGVYTATYGINENYKWSDGSTDVGIIVTLNIGAKSVGAKPSSEYSSDFYHIIGMDQLYPTPAHVTRIPSTEEYPDIGDYTFTYTLDPNYRWSDNTTEPVTVVYHIVKTSVDPPDVDKRVINDVCSTDYVTNRYEKPAGVDLEGDDRGLYVGTYTAIYSLKRNYIWSDNTEDPITVVLNLGYNTNPMKPRQEIWTRNETYTGDWITVWPNKPDGIGVTGDWQGLNVGTYVAKYKPFERRYKWSDNTEDEVEVTLTIVRASVGNRPTNPQPVPYDGQRHDNIYTRHKPDGVEETGSPSGIQSGDYIAYYQPYDNYCWNDGGTEKVPITLTITPTADLEKPSELFPRAEYTGNLINNGYTRPDPEVATSVGADSGIAVGEYTMTYTPIGNHAWSDDGTQTPISVVLTIYNKSVGPKPTNKSAEYTGNPINNGYYPTPTGVNMRDDSVPIGTDIGTYNSWYSPKVNYCWDDESISEVPVVLTITKRSCGPKPTNPAEKYYNGIEQTNDYDKPISVEFVEGYTADRGTNPGVYVAKYKPAATYTWSDGTEDIVEITLIINKTSVGNKPSYTEIVGNYDGVTTHLNGYTTDQGTKPAHVGFYDGYTADRGKELGEYVAKYKPDFGYCWNDGTEDVHTITLYIRNAHVGPKPTSPDPKYYTGIEQTNDYDKPNHVSFVDDCTADRGTIVGTYIAKYQPDLTYTWDDGTRDIVTVTLTIVRVSVGDKPQDVSYDYDGNEHDNGYIEGKRPAIGVEYLRGPEKGTNANQYIAYYQPDSNHKWSDDSTDEIGLVLTIRPTSVGNKPTNPDPVTYDGSEHNNGYTASVRPAHVSMISGGIESGIDVGTYNASYKPDTNYAWSDGTTSTVTLTLTITRASVGDKPTNPDPVAYDGSDHNNGYTYRKPLGVLETGIAVARLPGEYIAYYQPDSNHKWSDDSINVIPITMVINPIATVSKPTDLQQFTYNGSVQNPVIGDHIIYVSGDKDKINAGQYSTTVVPEAGYIWEYDLTSDNYTFNWDINKALLDVTLTDISYSFTYDNNEHRATDIPGYGISGLSWSPSPNPETYPGSYLYQVSPDSNHVWQDQSTRSVNVEMIISRPIAESASAVFMDQDVSSIVSKVFDPNSSESNPQTNNVDISGALYVHMVDGSQNSGYHTGNYVATYRLDEPYKWAEDVIMKYGLATETSDIIITLTITPFILDIARPVTPLLTSFEYDGNSHCDSYYTWLITECGSPYIHYINYTGIDDKAGWDNRHSGQVSMPYAIGSGLYNLYYYPAHNYAWSDGTCPVWVYDSAEDDWVIDWMSSTIDNVTLDIMCSKIACPICQANMYQGEGFVPYLRLENGGCFSCVGESPEDRHCGSYIYASCPNCWTQNLSLEDGYIKCTNYNCGNIYYSVDDLTLQGAVGTVTCPNCYTSGNLSYDSMTWYCSNAGCSSITITGDSTGWCAECQSMTPYTFTPADSKYGTVLCSNCNHRRYSITLQGSTPGPTPGGDVSCPRCFQAMTYEGGSRFYCSMCMQAWEVTCSQGHMNVIYDPMGFYCNECMSYVEPYWNEAW